MAEPFALVDRLQHGLDQARDSDGAQAAVDPSSAQLPRSTKRDGRFVIDEAHFPRWVDFNSSFATLAGNTLKWQWKMKGGMKMVAPPSQAVLNRELPVFEPDRAALESPPAGKVQVTWLGHASVLVQCDGWTMLADPLFSERCGPVQWAGPARAKRVRPAPLQVAGLPRVDAIVISHNHYDHLDETSVRDLARAQPRAIFFVPLGMKKWFRSLGVHRAVVEMDWSESVVLRDEDVGWEGAAARPDLSIICVPCQHWCNRGAFDVNKCLWSSWVCKSENFAYYFGGDTGYCGEIFSKIGALYGPVDVAAIPIGAYGVPEERWFHRPVHMDPEEAVACHMDLRCRQSVGIHWGTFAMTGEPLLEPPQRVAAALIANELPRDAFVCLNPGETRAFALVAGDRGRPLETEETDG
jgi:N-acyl-phosphatidylethanolamine-hydrolysing phospholipase D